MSEEAKLWCRCCGECWSSFQDEDVGPVCEECYWRLKSVRNDLFSLSNNPEKK